MRRPRLKSDSMQVSCAHVLSDGQRVLYVRLAVVATKHWICGEESCTTNTKMVHIPHALFSKKAFVQVSYDIMG